MTRIETIQQVFAERTAEEKKLTERHPWVPILFNWLIVITAIALVVAFILWGIDIKIQNTANERTAQALAVREAEQQAAEEAKLQELAAIQASEDYIIDKEAEDCAKALYGIRLFVEKYSYTETDLITYLRSAFNRSDAKSKSLHDVLSEKDQYLAYSESNPVLDDYKQAALKAVKEWHTETTKPCDVSYQFAELTENGIWLRNDFNANGYARRWRYS